MDTSLLQSTHNDILASVHLDTIIRDLQVQNVNILCAGMLVRSDPKPNSRGMIGRGRDEPGDMLEVGPLYNTSLSPGLSVLAMFLGLFGYS